MVSTLQFILNKGQNIFVGLYNWTRGQFLTSEWGQPILLHDSSSTTNRLHPLCPVRLVHNSAVRRGGGSRPLAPPPLAASDSACSAYELYGETTSKQNRFPFSRARGCTEQMSKLMTRLLAAARSEPPAAVSGGAGGARARTSRRAAPRGKAPRWLREGSGRGGTLAWPRRRRLVRLDVLVVVELSALEHKPEPLPAVSAAEAVWRDLAHL